MTLPERISAKFAVNVDTGCWEWTAAKSATTGYGQVRWEGKPQYAHRVVYLLLVGPIPDDRPQLDHLCRVRHCVNPDHLEPVTQRVNILRGEAPHVVAGVNDVCVAGLHELRGDNVYVRANGWRFCRACANARGRARYAERQSQS